MQGCTQRVSSLQSYDFRLRIQRLQRQYAENCRKLLLALRRALLALRDVSDSDGGEVVFSDDEIDMPDENGQTALMRFRHWKELFRDPPLPWATLTFRRVIGGRRTSWMEHWIDRQLEDLDRQLDEPGMLILFCIDVRRYIEYLSDRFRLDWFAFRMSCAPEPEYIDIGPLPED